MNTLDKLMKMDVQKISERPTKPYEVKRLSRITGEPFVLTLQSIPADLYADIQEDAISLKKADVQSINIHTLQSRTVIEGIKDPCLKDKELLKKFGVHTPGDLINTLFLPGEISDIAAEISALCGYDSQKDIDEEIKN